MPTCELTAEDFADGKISVLDMLVKSKLAPSKAEGKRLIMQGGVFLNDEKVADFGKCVGEDEFANDVVIRKGKKAFYRFIKK